MSVDRIGIMYTPNIILLNEKKYFCISEDAYILGKSRDKCDGVNQRRPRR